MTGDESSARTCSEEARVKAGSLGEKASGMEKKDDSNFQPEHLGEGTCMDIMRNVKGGINRPVFMVNKMPSKAKLGILKLTVLAVRTPCYAKSLQSCPTLCDPIEGSPPGSPVPGILQARTLEWVAISFSNA